MTHRRHFLDLDVGQEFYLTEGHAERDVRRWKKVSEDEAAQATQFPSNPLIIYLRREVWIRG